MSSRALSVGVIGGGIGGMATAAALLQRGVDVHVYEQSEQIGEVGAGVSISPNGVRALCSLGLEDAIRRVGARAADGYDYDEAGTVVQVLSKESRRWSPETDSVYGVWGIHRADLLDMLSSLVPPERIHPSHRLDSVQPGETSATVTFENGVSEEFDVVVGADGVRSRVRSAVAENPGPVDSGVVAYRGLLPDGGWQRVEPARELWIGTNKHFMTYPVRGGSLVNYVGFVKKSEALHGERWSGTSDNAVLADAFAGWEPRVIDLIERVENVARWGLYDIEPIDTYVTGRVALVGDAAHAMLPHLGQGANTSLEDAICLGILLGDAQPDAITEALELYDALRRPRTQRVPTETRTNGLRYDSEGEFVDMDERSRAEDVAKTKQFTGWLYEYDVVAETENAARSSRRGTGS